MSNTIRNVAPSLAILALCAVTLGVAFTGHDTAAQILGAVLVVSSTIALADHRRHRDTTREHVPWAARARAFINRAGPVTLTLVVVNLALAVAVAISAASVGADPVVGEDGPLFRSWALVPATVTDGRWWTLITSAFLHAGPTHLAVNMITLAGLGGGVERRLGHARYAALYVAALLGASLTIWLFSDDPTRMVVGASGAIFGVFGAGAAFLLHEEPRDRYTIGVLAVVIGGSLAFGLLPGVSFAGHLGGLITGLAATGAYLAVTHCRRPHPVPDNDGPTAA